MAWTRRTVLAAGASALALGPAAPRPAAAQDADDSAEGSADAALPASIRYVIPFGPGGESDIAARLQQAAFRDAFGIDLVIEYRPGGGGAVGWSALNSMAADGSVVMGVNLPHIAAQPLMRDAGYTTDALSVIALFHYTPDALLVARASPFDTLADFVAAARTRRGALSVVGSGPASANHLAQIRFDRLAGIETDYRPHKGSAAAAAALIDGQGDAQWGYTSVALAQGSAVRPLAVATEERHPRLPDTPTFRELGYDLVGGAERGVAVPQGTPEAVKRALSERFLAVNDAPGMAEAMADAGLVPLSIGLDAVAAHLRRYGARVRGELAALDLIDPVTAPTQ